MGLKLTSDVVDQNKESMRLAKIKAIYEMQYGFDIYQIQDWGYKNKNNKNFSRIVHYKQIRRFKQMHYNQIKLLINFNTFKGMHYIKASLLKTKLAREIFIADIEQGREIYIPDEISIERYPVSFRFYDSTIKLVRNMLSDDIKQYFSFKNTFRMEFY